MIRTRLLTPVAFAVALSFFALPAAAGQHRGGGGSHGGYSHGHSAVRVAPRVVVAPHGYYQQPYYRPYYRPYYSFRPHFSLGIGLWVGYPVAYPSYYGYPYGYGYPPYGYGYDYRYPYPPANPYGYGYPPPPAYGYPPPNYPGSNYSGSNYSGSNYPGSNYSGSNYPGSNYSGSSYPGSNYPASNYPASNYPGSQAPQRPNTSVSVQPGQQRASGGVSVEVSPTTAAIFVDGDYMGTGADFGPSSPPLGLNTGRHRIEVRAEGYQSMSFNADVIAGQVIPFQATLQRR